MEFSETVLLSNLQKEQERERRRMRDRQRRQSMTIEQREKHLARRRRNYQLRRQRVEVTRLDPQLSQTLLTNRGQMLVLPSDENEAMVSVPDISNHCYSVALVVSGQRKESLKAAHTSFMGLEVPANQLAKLPVRSRLNHIKHLARSLEEPVDIGDSHKIAANWISMDNADSSSLHIGDCISGTPQRGLRLNCVKRLARALKSGVVHIAGQNHESETEEFPLTNGNLPEYVQPDNLQREIIDP